LFATYDDPRNRCGYRWSGGRGGIIGGGVGHPGAGAAIGSAFGLGTGALIGDRLQAMEQKQTDLEKQIKDDDGELKRQRQELEILKKQSER